MERQEHAASAEERDAAGQDAAGRDAAGQDRDISVTRARQAVAPHIVRYVLGIGLVLAVVALGLTLILGGV
jgi:hypothetical protein